MADVTEVVGRLLTACLTEKRPAVIGLTGARSCGKTRLIEQYADALGKGGIPYARIDVLGEALDQATPSVMDLLDMIVGRFTAGPAHYGRAKFPRYLLARSTLRLPLDGHTTSERIAAIGDHLRIPWLRDNLPQIIGDLANAVAELNDLPGEPAGRITGRVVGGLFRGRAGDAIKRPGTRWFADNELIAPANSAAAGLAFLWEWHHGTLTALREKADRVLVAALLADLRASAESGSWDGTYPLLIDDADGCNAATGLVCHLAGLLTPADRLTVAATHRGPLLATVAAVVDGAPVTDPVKVPVADERRLPPAGVHWWPLLLPDLGWDDILALLRTETQWQERARFAARSAVYRFTRGHPGATTYVCKQLASRPEPAGESVDLRAVLDDRELEDLLTVDIGVAAKARLVTCAAVRDREHVKIALNPDAVGVPALRTVLRDELWVKGRAGRLVLLPVLRRLLLDRLAERPEHAPDGWVTIFTHLATHARDHADIESELYYTLALGEAETVTRRLYEGLGNGDPSAWARLLRRVTLAPARFTEPGNEAEITRQTGWCDDSGLTLHTLANLVVRLWLKSDGLRPAPDREAIAVDYETLAVLVPSFSPELHAEAAKWRSGHYE